MTDLGLLALRFHEMVVRHTLVDFTSCHYDMAVCHARNHTHFVAHQYDGGGGCFKSLWLSRFAIYGADVNYHVPTTLTQIVIRSCRDF